MAAVLQRHRSDIFRDIFAFFSHSSHSHMRKQWRLAFVYLMTQFTQSLICSFRISWRRWRGIKDVKTSSPSLIPRHSYSFTRHCRMLSTCMNMSTCVNIQHMHCEEFLPSSSVRGLHDGSTMRAQPMFNGVCLPSNYNRSESNC